MKIRSLVAILVLAIAPLALAQHPQAVIGKYLQLTPDQIASWKQINTDTSATVQPRAAKAKGLQKQLAAALDANADSATVGNLTLALHDTRAQIRAARQAANAKRTVVLTAEQKTKFEAFQAAVQFLRSERRAAARTR